MLQELIADKFWLTFALSSIAKGYQQVTAFPLEGRGDLALLIHPNITITNSGTFSNGSTIWASLIGLYGSLNVASLYASNTPSSHANLWLTLKNNLPHGEWIFGKDYNFTKMPIDSTTQASLALGRELDKWWALKSWLGLVDIFNIIHSHVGPPFTWQRLVEGTLIQSLPDRFHYNNHGWWINFFLEF